VLVADKNLRVVLFQRQAELSPTAMCVRISAIHVDAAGARTRTEASVSRGDSWVSIYLTHPVREYGDGMAIPSSVESTDASH
jgi:hypothetical protein